MRNGRGLDGRVDLARIARVLDPLDADVIALQEIDRGRERSGAVDQPAELGRLLGRHPTFYAAVDHPGDGHYGHLLLSRAAPISVERIALPRVPLREPRGALDVRLATALGEVRVVSTHLGLLELERRWQIRPLLRRLDEADARAPALLLGDLNAGPRRGTLRALRRRLSDAASAHPQRTWHAALPLRRLDYVLVSEGLQPVSTEVLDGAEPCRASDHRALVARLRRR